MRQGCGFAASLEGPFCSRAGLPRALPVRAWRNLKGPEVHYTHYMFAL